MRALIFTALLVLMCLPIRANAQDAAAPAPKFGQACSADIQQYCPNMTPGPDRHKCILTNLSKMSPDCQTAVNAMQSDTTALWQACGEDFRKYCKGIAGPARAQCLSQNETQFSTTCQAEMAKHPTPAQH